jgi:hypothetical protein
MTSPEGEEVALANSEMKFFLRFQGRYDKP